MIDNELLAARTHTSARALVAFFCRQLQTEIELIHAPPEAIGTEHVVFGAALQERGFWGVRSGRPLSDADRGEVAATFLSILGPSKPAYERTPDLMRLEAKLDLAREAAASNVISLSAARTRRLFPVGEVVGPAAKRILKRDCLIEYSDSREIHKVAFELHARGSRQIFIPFNDLSREVRRCFTSLLNLGPISLFVPDLLALPLDEQVALRTLGDFYWNVRPLVFYGVRRGTFELRMHPGVDQELLATLLKSHLRLSGPMNRDQDTSEWLEMLEANDD